MSNLGPYRTHVRDGLDRLLMQYKFRPRLAAWLAVYLKGVQELDDATWEVFLQRYIDNAVGEQLDVLGRVVLELRQDRDDDTYRLFIKARIAINRSKGTSQDMLNVLAIVSEIDPTPLLFTEYHPASFYLEFLDVPAYDPVLLLSMFRDAKAAGVGFTMISPTAPPTTQFRWKSVGDADDPLKGFGDANNPTDTFGLLSDAVTMRTAYTGPLIVGITPTVGPEVGGTDVVVELTSTEGVTGAKLGGAALTDFAIVDGTHVSGKTGARAPGQVGIEILTEVRGTGFKSSAFTYQPVGTPTTLAALFGLTLLHRFDLYDQASGVYVDTVGGHNVDDGGSNPPNEALVNGHRYPVFNGLNNGLSGADLTTLDNATDWTIGLTMRTLNGDAYGGLVVKGQAFYVELSSLSGALSITIGNGGGADIVGSIPVDDNLWHRVVITCNAGVVRAFVDATFDGTDTGGQISAGVVNPLLIGQQPNGVVTDSGIGVVFIALKGLSDVEVGYCDAILENEYTGALVAPTVSAVTPNTGVETGGTAVTVDGTGFEAGATAFVRDSGGTWDPCTSVVVVGPTEITCETPAGINGLADFKVVNTDGLSGVLLGGFEYTSVGASAPVVIGIVPGTGTTAGGTHVVIEVDDSTGATGAAIDGVALSGFAIDDATHVSGDTGAHAAGTNLDVTVTNAFGTGTLPGGFDYVAPGSAPTVTSLTNGIGSRDGGGTESLRRAHGTGFTGATAMTINGVNVTSFTINSDTEIQFVPPAATGAHATNGGTCDVVVTHPTTGPSTGGAGLYEYWDPELEAGCVWGVRKGNYVTGPASFPNRIAGRTSLTEITNPPAALAGAPDFDGVNNVLGSTDNPVTLFGGTSANPMYSAAIDVDTIAPIGASAWLDAPLFMDAGGYTGLTLYEFAGVYYGRMYWHDTGAPKVADVVLGGVGKRVLHGKRDATNLFAANGSGAWTAGHAGTAILGGSGTFRLGYWGGAGLKYDGRINALYIFDVVKDDAYRTKFSAWATAEGML